MYQKGSELGYIAARQTDRVGVWEDDQLLE